MYYIKFLDSSDVIVCTEFKAYMTHVEITSNLSIENLSGFMIYLDKNCTELFGNYRNHKKIYKQKEANTIFLEME